MEKKVVDILDDEVVEEKKTTKKENVQELKEQINSLKISCEDLNNKYLMALAEQKNYKKRCDDEMDRFYKYHKQDILKELLPVLDSLDLALAKENVSDEVKAYLEGVRVTRNQLKSILEKEEVVEIEALGKEFDPNTMLAVSSCNMPDKKDQEVVNVFIKGYMYKDRVLRAANVIVNTKEE